MSSRQRIATASHDAVVIATGREYDHVSAEYYDSERHPTCGNFRSLSRAILSDFLTGEALGSGAVVEVGCGLALTPELAPGSPLDFPGRELILSDGSPLMLEHSRDFERQGYSLVTAPAWGLPLPDRSAGVVISSLGDPYNILPFWSEVARILADDGVALFTTPAYDWSSRYRTDSGSAQHQAEFTTRNGRVHPLPSIILPDDLQRRLVGRARLRIDRTAVRVGADLKGERISPKLHGFEATPCVVGYAVRRDAYSG